MFIATEIKHYKLVTYTHYVTLHEEKNTVCVRHQTC